MKKFGMILSLAVVTTLLAASALAQNVGDKSVYFTTFYANANIAGVPDGTVRIINDGDTGATLWASFYVFDDSQELQECCSCSISPDGILSESVNLQLLGNPLTGTVNHVGVIKVISSTTGNPTANTPAPGLHGSATWDIAQNATDTVKNGVTSNAVNAYLLLEHPLSDANLIPSEQSTLQTLCSYALDLGSGHGECACTPEDADF
jgi:hypothetical protein